MQETQVQSLGQKDPLEKEMSMHSSILAWRVPWTEEPGRLPSTGSQRFGHDWATEWQQPLPPSPCLSVSSPALILEEGPVRTAPGTPVLSGISLDVASGDPGVSKSRTRLSDFTSTFPFHALEKEMATHPSVLAWRIPGTAEPGGLPSLGSHRVGHDWSDSSSSGETLQETQEREKKIRYFCRASSSWLGPALSTASLSPLHQGCSTSVPSISRSGQASMLMSQPVLTRGSHFVLAFQDLESNFTSWIFLSTPELHSGPIHCLKSAPAPRTEKGKSKLEEREARTWSLLLTGEVGEWRRPRQCEASGESWLHSRSGWEKCDYQW